MAGKIIICSVCFGCAILFYMIGIYAKKRMKPMWFYSGTEVKETEIRDVKEYNKANGTMWQIYAVGYAIAGVLEWFYPVLAVVILMLNCIVGTLLLVVVYTRIYNRYKA